jgi:exodeoxyribonuclease X
MAHVIRLVDFETTGMEPPAEVVEVGYCDLTKAGPEAPWIVEEPVSRLCAVAAIPPEVRAVHWIRHAETVGCAPFDAMAFVESSDHCAALAAHNMEFENRWLQTDGVMPLICTLKAAYRVWPEAPGHSNSTLRCWLEDQGLIVLDEAKAFPAHRAGPDAYVSAHILAALFAAGATGKELVQWTREPKAFPTCPIGEWRGKKWSEVDAGFLRWMTTKAGMEADYVWNAQRELERRKVAA